MRDMAIVYGTSRAGALKSDPVDQGLTPCVEIVLMNTHVNFRKQW